MHFLNRKEIDGLILEGVPILEFDQPQEVRAAGRVLRVQPCGIVSSSNRIETAANASAECAERKPDSRFNGIISPCIGDMSETIRAETVWPAVKDIIVHAPE